MLPNRVKSSASAWISRALGPCESRMDSTLSRTMSTVFEDGVFHKVRFSNPPGG